MKKLEKVVYQKLMQKQKAILDNYHGNFEQLNKVNKLMFYILNKNGLTAYDTESNNDKMAIFSELERGIIR